MNLKKKINDFIKKDYKSANLNAGFMINPYTFAISGNTFEDNYTSNTGWTQVGTSVTVDSFTAGKVASNLANASVDHRVWKSLGVTLSDSLWIYEFDFLATTKMTDNSDFPAILAAGSAIIRDGSQDALGVMFQGAYKLNIYYRDVATPVESSQITISLATQYYIRLERTSTTNAKLSVFSNSGRTSHVSGSPVNFTIPSTVTGLTHIHHGTGGVNSQDTSSWTVDNTRINNNSSTIL